MPKHPPDPKKWLPDPAVDAKEKMNLLQAWSQYCENIAQYRRFKDAPATILDYTSALMQIEAALGEKSIYQLDPFTIMDIVASAPGRVNSRGDYVEYSVTTLAKRLTIIRDILLYLESARNFSNPLSYKMYALLRDGLLERQTSAELQTELRDKFKNKILPRYLTTKQEQKLMREILLHITEDGRWLALAILLWCGVRASELRGLHFDDIKAFVDYADREYVCFCRSAESDGREKPTMKNKYGPRSIPEHVELRCALEKRINYVMEAMGRTDISELPAITCGNNFLQPCTSGELLIFTQAQLKKVFGREYMDELMLLFYLSDPEKEEGIDGDRPDDPIDLMVDMQFGTRIYRRNFCTKNYAETHLGDWESRLEMGHRTESKVSSPYGEAHLAEMLCAMEHRMILPEIRDDWHTVFKPGKDTIYKEDVGIHYLSVPKEELAKLQKIYIDVDLDCAGDDFLLEFLHRVPAEAIKITTEYIPKKVQASDARCNTDAAHWPLSWDVAKEDLDKKRNG